MANIEKPVEEITVGELAARAVVAGGRLPLVDVREDDEWIDEHVPWATHVALGTVPDHLELFGPDDATDPTYVICKVGGRSMRACEFAVAHGKHVVNVAGGMLAWTAGGHDTVGGR